MEFTHCCSENIKSISEFYKKILQVEPQIHGDKGHQEEDVILKSK